MSRHLRDKLTEQLLSQRDKRTQLCQEAFDSLVNAIKAGQEVTYDSWKAALTIYEDGKPAKFMSLLPIPRPEGCTCKNLHHPGDADCRVCFIPF